MLIGESGKPTKKFYIRLYDFGVCFLVDVLKVYGYTVYRYSVYGCYAPSPNCPGNDQSIHRLNIY